MPLTLSLAGQGPLGPVQEVRSLDRGSLSLGRGPQNDWVLQDASAQLSKLHCTIAFVGGNYVLTDVSTNGVFLNGAPERMPRDSQVVLQEGDEFRLGDYVVRVSTQGPAPAAFAPAASTLVAGDPFAADLLENPLGAPVPGFSHPQRIEAPMPRGLDPFDIAEESRPTAPEIDRFHGRDADPSWSGAAQRDNADIGNHYFAAPRVVAQPTLSDADLDALLGDLPLGPAAASPAVPPTPLAPVPAAIPGQPVGLQPPAAAPLPADIDFDELLGDLTPGQGFSPVPPVAPPPGPAAPPMTVDVSAVPPVVGSAPMVAPVPPPAVAEMPAMAPSPAPAPPIVAHLAPVLAPAAESANPFDEPDRPGLALAVPAAPTAQAALPPAVAPTQAMPAAAAPGAGTAVDATRLLAAFLEGAGQPKVDLAGQDPEAYFRLVGQLMKAMVENLRDVLMSRAEVKRGFGIEQTMLQVRNNNVLKFSVTPEDAVAAILQPGRPGYLPPLKATEDAFRDLRSHQLAVMAGVQAALVALLKRFDPAAIEARITGAGLLGNLLPGSRKSRTWELFCSTYADIAREAEEDFQAVFGREFARAYQEQEKKL
ncbi:type VI secretion system-associated FHA domain protein TagH [Siccirubricoccus sp. KC 17139]|uniref:Type VI secretion system-associated FHA domain protein TagH n=1 Tax=Siccirubricoccus soli TaxID=2899147 RepID=A0ABT1D7M8_9PROT|nr:type VI secretion system-associated FHA domain protein TagH [Siccirubricoccus soli]MCO6417941.1 type VI secretion system-associated FHA domain protein TagH [Siccirubricoccus soli]MCP2684076.1 type VI secretion system-associated FHA domain protein TagH [Siccirubricoccus soli]